jgi:hypothetical protein
MKIGLVGSGGREHAMANTTRNGKSLATTHSKWTHPDRSLAYPADMFLVSPEANIRNTGRRPHKECRTWIKGTLGKIENDLTYKGTQVTLEHFVEMWLEGKELPRRPHTVLQYRQVVHQHILPHRGKMRLQDIQPAHVKQLYFKKRGEGRGARTVQLVHTVLNCVLKEAVREGLLGRNPVDAVERPKVE